MKKPINIKKIFKRIKNLSFFEVMCILYIIFCIHFAISNFNDEPLKPEKEFDTNNNSNVTENVTEVVETSAIISPIKSYISSNPLYQMYDNILLSEVESNSFLSEINNNSLITEESTQKTSQSEEIIVEQETTAVIESETTTQLEITDISEYTEDSFPKPELSDDITNDEYIYNLIEFYSSYNTRIALTYDNIYWLSKMIYNESRGEIFEGQIAVAEVAINRLLSSPPTTTIKDILLEPNQFSVGKKTNKSCILAAVYAILGANPTHGAYYFADISKAPNFFAVREGYKISCKIGCHTFFLKETN